MCFFLCGTQFFKNNSIFGCQAPKNPAQHCGHTAKSWMPLLDRDDQHYKSSQDTLLSNFHFLHYIQILHCLKDQWWAFGPPLWASGPNPYASVELWKKNPPFLSCTSPLPLPSLNPHYLRCSHPTIYPFQINWKSLYLIKAYVYPLKLQIFIAWGDLLEMTHLG